MEVRRIFVDKLKMKNGMAILTGPMHRYLAQVLRKGPGDRIDLIDGKGYLYRCTIGSIKAKEIYVQVLDVVHHPEEKHSKVTLCVSPIKGPRMDWLIEKATELGVERIIPTLFKRTVVKVEEKDKTKLERWRRITIEASRQSGRFTIPDVAEPAPLRAIIPLIGSPENRWVLHEKEKIRRIDTVIPHQKEGGICVVIGPEGGIEPGEIQWLEENGFLPCTLGEHIFRTETAPLVILSIILYEYGKK